MTSFGNFFKWVRWLLRKDTTNGPECDMASTFMVICRKLEKRSAKNGCDHLGLILSFLYCFLHVEVHTAIRQNFNRFLERRRLNLSLRSQTEQTFTNRRKRSFTSMNPCHSYDTEVTSQLQEAHQFVSPQQICTSSLRSDKSRNGLYESECRGQKNSVRQDCVSLIDGNAFPSESIPLSRILETENCSEL
eukprot:XP_014780075.1 PREDICTED: uncharacterized protein LOC106876163 [Octopus bimaculoides]